MRLPCISSDLLSVIDDAMVTEESSDAQPSTKIITLRDIERTYLLVSARLKLMQHGIMRSELFRVGGTARGQCASLTRLLLRLYYPD